MTSPAPCRPSCGAATTMAWHRLLPCPSPWPPPPSSGIHLFGRALQRSTSEHDFCMCAPRCCCRLNPPGFRAVQYDWRIMSASNLPVRIGSVLMVCAHAPWLCICRRLGTAVLTCNPQPAWGLASSQNCDVTSCPTFPPPLPICAHILTSFSSA